MTYGQNPPYPPGGQPAMPATQPPSTMLPAKIDQTTAAYGPADDPSRSCSTCLHFDGAGSCDIVDGAIAPDGVSDYWEPAAGGGAPAPMGELTRADLPDPRANLSVDPADLPEPPLAGRKLKSKPSSLMLESNWCGSSSTL